MPFVKILVHAVWATKDRKPLLTTGNREILCNHIREYAATKSADQNIATVMNLLKGESSFGANKNLKWAEKFGWQDEYFAVSVSQSQLEVVNNYITNQEDHHRRKTFQEEYDEFINSYEFVS